MENKGRMKIRVKIINEENGQVIYDEVGTGILGAHHISEGKTTGLISGGFSSRSTFESLLALKNIEKKMYAQRPQLEKIMALADLVGFEDAIDRTEIDMSALLKME